MKNCRFLLPILLFTLLSCGGDPSGADTNSGGQSLGQPTGGTVSTPARPADQSRESLLLARDYWVFEFYVIPNDKETAQFNRGRWYSFQPDGTFLGGHWEEHTSNGVWRLDRREGKVFLILDSNIDAEDAEWNIQVNAAGDAMSWVGTKNYDRNTHMIKAISLLSRPTKKQFGIE